ncbi:MAG: rane protein-like protein [Solirubrobacterales bacterium]|nr:rane protein-like protein [Solirubrobacterales bacterium]
MGAVSGRPLSTSPLPSVRSGLHRRARWLRSAWWSIAQSAVAAATAWALASLVNQRPFFAPVSAVISLGLARGRRTHRAVELVIGVAVGIAVADVIVRVLGTGTLVIGLVVALSMAAALLFGAGAVLVNQAAVSGILVATIQPPGGGLSPTRFVDALIGGAVALLVGQVLFPRNPLRALAEAAQPVVDDLAVALRTVGEALRKGDVELAERALEIARAVDDDLAGFYDAVALARETVPVVAARRPRERLPIYAEAALQMDHAVRNTRVLARRAVASVRHHGAAPAPLADAVELLADAVVELGHALAEPGHAQQARRLALEAAKRAMRALDEDPGLSAVVIVGQVRSTALDILLASGLGIDEARAAVEGATDDDKPDALPDSA